MTPPPGHVLVVDDEAAVHAAICEYLAPERCEVLWAPDAESALARLADQEVDVVLLDVSLPGRSGKGLLPDIVTARPDAVVIALTGDGGASGSVEPHASGACCSLRKPLDGEAVRSYVIGALDRRSTGTVCDGRVPHPLAAFDTVPDAVLIVDSAGRVTHVNRAGERLFGVERAHVLARSAAQALPKPMTELATLLQDVCDRGRAVRERRVEVLDTRGDEWTVIATVLPVAGAAHEPAGAVLLAREAGAEPRLPRERREWHQHPRIVGKSSAMADVFALLRKVADTDATVLICGESGTGKEVIAAALREVGPRAEKPYVRVNCAALSETLLESELFGHVKGAFTGAVADRVGRFEMADGGTIFLDEIGDMSQRMQARLLRVLQEGEYERVGESRSRSVDVRVIAATNQTLERKIAAGEFRSDLYYRLNVVRFDLPPLRDRRTDIPLLVEHFRAELNGRLGKNIQGVAQEALELLTAYQWPGNVRELQNYLERAFIVCGEPWLQARHLPPQIHGGALMRSGAGDPHAPARLPEEERVRAALIGSGWNVARAARRLGVSRPTIYRKMMLYKLKRPGAE